MNTKWAGMDHLSAFFSVPDRERARLPGGHRFDADHSPSHVEHQFDRLGASESFPTPVIHVNVATGIDRYTQAVASNVAVWPPAKFCPVFQSFHIVFIVCAEVLHRCNVLSSADLLFAAQLYRSVKR